LGSVHHLQKLAINRQKAAEQREKTAEQRQAIKALYINSQTLVGSERWSEDMIHALLGQPDVNDKGVFRYLRSRYEAAKQDPRFADMLRRSKLITQSTLLRRGWTLDIIKDFLHDPDVLAENPHYKKSAPMRLFFVGRVEDAEATPAFLERKKKAIARSTGAKKAAVTRKSNIRITTAVNNVIDDFLEREDRVLRSANDIIASIIEKQNAPMKTAEQIARETQRAETAFRESIFQARINALPQAIRDQVSAATRLPKGTPNKKRLEREAYNTLIRLHLISEPSSQETENQE
jgi:hypothetical protein